MSINDFKNTLTGGGARSNRFEVVVEFPAFAGGSEEIRSTPFLATSAQLPGSTIGTIEQAFRGRVLKLAGDRTFEDFSVSFINDTNFALRDAFELWHNAINAYNSNTSAVSPDEYLVTVSVHQLNNNDERIKSYSLLNAFPTSIGSIELSQDSNNSIEEFDVTFAYSDMGSNTTS